MPSVLKKSWESVQGKSSHGQPIDGFSPIHYLPLDGDFIVSFEYNHDDLGRVMSTTVFTPTGDIRIKQHLYKIVDDGKQRFLWQLHSNAIPVLDFGIEIDNEIQQYVISGNDDRFADFPLDFKEADLVQFTKAVEHENVARWRWKRIE
ncbi:hypothetical protein [Planctobacterium marinum]|uniref:hypothetical protein n=1 Tax=Planctobacterium marinum TaxID=1631968 RepID=UPI001E3E8521|nr:hypothetical protein [Planctobacterium marinum]MCC2608059.1 hypothetical protein [Planctobacterium marinum]